MTYNADYVDLLKKVLRNSIYDRPAEVLDSDVMACERALASIRQSKPFVLEKYNKLNGASLAKLLAYTKQSRTLHTYVRAPGLANIEDCIRCVCDDAVPGDLVDVGTLRGGTAILMRGVLRALGDVRRRVIVADSFEGLPRPSELDSLFDREIWYALADVLPQYNLRCAETLENVRHNFEAYDLLDGQVEFLPGWFKDTLKTLAGRALALIRIDADFYEGTRDALESLYSDLSPGGFIVIDDYKLDGCKSAVDEFRVSRRVFDKMLVADAEDGVVYWRKGVKA